MFDATQLLQSHAASAASSSVVTDPDEIGTPDEPMTLQQAKEHLRVVVSDDDDQIAGMIVAARMMLEGRLNRALVHIEVVEVVDGFASGMPLSTVPYLDGLQIEYVDPDGATQTYDGAFYLDARKEPARLYPLFGESWPAVRSGHGAVTLRYHAGYDGNVPAPLVHWMKLAIGTMYEHRSTVVTGVSIAELPEDFMKWLWQPYMVYS